MFKRLRSLEVHSTQLYTLANRAVANSYLLMTLFHSFTFANAQGTDLRTGTVAISCLRPTHSGVAQVQSASAILPALEPSGRFKAEKQNNKDMDPTGAPVQTPSVEPGSYPIQHFLV